MLSPFCGGYYNTTLAHCDAVWGGASTPSVRPTGAKHERELRHSGELSKQEQGIVFKSKTKWLFTTKRSFQVYVQDLVLLGIPDEFQDQLSMSDYILNDAQYYQFLMLNYAAMNTDEMVMAMAKIDEKMTISEALKISSSVRENGIKKNSNFYAEALKRNDDEFSSMYLNPYQSMA